MDNQAKGEELNQLSRLLFDRAADRWYLAVLIEILAGLLGVIIGLVNLTDKGKVLFAVLGFILLGIAYALRLWFDVLYDRAETMRRQSVLTEGLGWPISKTLFSDWRLKAGKKILDEFKRKPRNKDYYETQEVVGPSKLLNMTIESAFWTRHLYSKLEVCLWAIFIASAIVFFLLVSIVTATPLSISMQLGIVYSVYLLLPLILSLDLLGWAMRLRRLSNTIKDIEEDMERIAEAGNIQESEVLRLVAEYNCQLAAGFPIHNKLFEWWHKEITSLWKRR